MDDYSSYDTTEFNSNFLNEINGFVENEKDEVLTEEKASEASEVSTNEQTKQNPQVKNEKK